ncbi:Arylsulfatase [Rubripirellula lacrimiformis]|uniref:Arylsulfatase n=2 Tax=Rubripirellula lacrimiformis TaxID=1930273 RepID=A0A517NKL4_9BACT|nr:Arylsulfatase [Rubripirellula lacrimiformis]
MLGGLGRRRIRSIAELVFAVFLFAAFGCTSAVGGEIAGADQATGTISGSATQADQRPNVLLIYLDDFGWRDCGFMGSDFYETPHLDALAARGMVFTNAYSSAANCAPARACLLSGQYTPRHEIYNVGTERRGNPKYGKLEHVPGVDTLPTNIRTWAHQIRDAGYRTGSIGKWHVSNDPLPYGFDFNFAGTHSGSPPRGYFPPHPKAPGLEDAPDDEYLTDRLTDEAIGFIDRNQDTRWMLYLTHFAVHTPLQGKDDLVAKYKQKPKGELHNHAIMAAMIQSVDEGIGRIIARLNQLGLDEKTAIVFTSDNGGYGPATSMAPLKGYKGTYFEGGIREPFFVVWPSVVEGGTKCDTPIIQVDLYPTLCEMTGADLPQDQPVDGISLVPLIKGAGPAAEPRSIFWHFPAYLQAYSKSDGQRDPLYRSRPCSVIRRGDWKLHEYFEDGKLMLFNLKDDIGESNDQSESNPAKTKQLHDELVAWRKATGAPVPSKPNPRYDADAEAKAIKRAM